MKYRRFRKRAYETLRALIKTPHRQSSIIDDNEGKQLAEEKSILKRWTEYRPTVKNFTIIRLILTTTSYRLIT